jgi:hypothetical protein
MPESSCGADTDNVLKSFLAGFFQNIAFLQLDGSYRTTLSSQSVYIHPSSALFGRKAKIVMYSDLIFTTKYYMHSVSAIEGEWAAEAMPSSLRSKTGQVAVDA